MTFYFLVLFGFYFVLLMVLRFGWTKAVRQSNSVQVNKTFFISIVVPFRNEEKNIELVLDSISKIDYPASNFEVILVNDHSTDDTIWVAENRSGLFKNLTIVSLDENKLGKKAALTRGIDLANGEIIVTTDADCLVPINWLTAINYVFQDAKIKLAAGMATISQDKSFFSQWQAMEFASVIGTGVAAFGYDEPFMCNGANLAFRKDTFREVGGYAGNAHIASGDDEFLLRKISKKYPHATAVLNVQGSVVVTQPQPSINFFLQQRLRWASKWKGNPSVTVKSLAIFILMAQASWVLFCFSFFSYSYEVDLLLVVLKMAADLLFLLPVQKFMKIKFRLLPFLGLQFLYPVYVLFIGIFSQLKNYEWKERTVLG